MYYSYYTILFSVLLLINILAILSVKYLNRKVAVDSYFLLLLQFQEEK